MGRTLLPHAFAALHITFRVAEPAGLARRLPLLANGVTDQGLGEVTSAARNGAGNPVLYDVGSSAGICHVLRILHLYHRFQPDLRGNERHIGIAAIPT